jgi:hypothetical protein
MKLLEQGKGVTWGFVLGEIRTDSMLTINEPGEWMGHRSCGNVILSLLTESGGNSYRFSPNLEISPSCRYNSGCIAT